VLAQVVVAGLNVQEGMGAAFGQGDRPCLGEAGGGPSAGDGAAELLFDLGDQGDFDGGAVNGDQTPTTPEAAGIALRIGKRAGQGSEKAFEDLPAEPEAALAKVDL